MSYIKYKLVFGRVKNPVKGNGQFHGPQVGSQVPAVFGHDFNDHLPDFRRQLIHFRQCESFQVQGAVDSVQNFIRHWVLPFS